MGGGLMQLVAYGAQDIYLTGNPQITYFKVVYRRHTNFALESVQQTIMGGAQFGKRATVTVSRNGDLINTAYLNVRLPRLTEQAWSLLSSPSPSPAPAGNHKLCWTNFVGLALINNISVEIGGQEVDRQYGLWMYVWQELTMTQEKLQGYKRMVGGNDSSGFLLYGNADEAQELHIPLTFWFNLNAGLALPLIALQYHEVKFIIHFRQVNELVVLVDETGNHVNREEFSVHSNQIDDPTIELFVDYVYLDTDERRRFAQMSHEYLIEQLQHYESSFDLSKGTHRASLNFNHPCSELIWLFQRHVNTENNDWFNFANATPGHEKLGSDILVRAGLSLNGHKRFNPERSALYFRQWQPFCHHTRIPDSHLYVYSFALRPEEHQPSGTCNFSRIDNTHLEFNTDVSAVVQSPVVPEHVMEFSNHNALMTVFARNYNVLRIMSGMGGLAYSN
jgi:hypothetical protein